MHDVKVDVAKIVKYIWRIFRCGECLTNMRKLFLSVDEVWLALNQKVLYAINEHHRYSSMNNSKGLIWKCLMYYGITFLGFRFQQKWVIGSMN
jgi:hypothetical protein